MGPNRLIAGICFLLALALAACDGGGGGNGPAASGPNPSPSLTSISPDAASIGETGLVVTASGTNFVPASVVEFNGAALPTSFVSPTMLEAQIPASGLSQVSSAAIDVMTPTPGGGTSNSVALTIGYSVQQISLTTNSLVWDPVNQVFYVSIPSTAAANGNTISVLDPSSGSITASQFAGSEPNLLAVSGGSEYLYVGVDGAGDVARFVLPGLTPDVVMQLGSSSIYGPYRAVDVEVAPGSPHTIAVSLGGAGPEPVAQGGTVIYDDITPRPTQASSGTYDSLQWGSDASLLFAGDTLSPEFAFYVLGVSTSGVSPLFAYPNFGFGEQGALHYDTGTFGIYTDGGLVIDPATGMQAGVFAASGIMVPDSAVGKAFFVYQTSTQFGSGSYTVASFNLNQFTAIDSFVLNKVPGTPRHLVRWGTDGLAFNTDQGAVYLIRGDFVN